jgi:hypothetical protein
MDTRDKNADRFMPDMLNTGSYQDRGINQAMMCRSVHSIRQGFTMVVKGSWRIRAIHEESRSVFAHLHSSVIYLCRFCV